MHKYNSSDLFHLTLCNGNKKITSKMMKILELIMHELREIHRLKGVKQVDRSTMHNYNITYNN